MDSFNHASAPALDDVSSLPSTEQSGAPIANEPWLASLHDVLESSTARPSVTVTASLLGVSARTMQRHLRRLGTSFRGEVKAVRGKASARPDEASQKA
jgi:hypothetical protein